MRHKNQRRKSKSKISAKRSHNSWNRFLIKLRWGRNLGLLIIFVGFPLVLLGTNRKDDIKLWAYKFFIQGTKSSGFVVQDILVEGRDRTSKKDILRKINVEYGAPILNVDPYQVQQQLQALPWVLSATVQRRLPNKIYIRLTERNPIALWQHHSKLHLIDDQGNVIDNFSLQKFSHLIIVIGKEAPKKVSSLLEKLNQFPTLKNRVTSATYVGNRRWDIVLDKTLKIKLPEENLDTALERVATLDQRHTLTSGQFKTIDVRLPDRSFLYVSADAMQDIETKGKKT